MRMSVSGSVEVDLPKKVLKANEPVYGLVEIRVKDEPHNRATASSGTIELCTGSLKTMISLTGDERDSAAAQFARAREIEGQQSIEDQDQ